MPLESRECTVHTVSENSRTKSAFWVGKKSAPRQNSKTNPRTATAKPIYRVRRLGRGATTNVEKEEADAPAPPGRDAPVEDAPAWMGWELSHELLGDHSHHRYPANESLKLRARARAPGGGAWIPLKETISNVTHTKISKNK